jgi:hypothetical protein
MNNIFVPGMVKRMKSSPELFQITFRPRNQISKSRDLGRERRGRR